MVSSLRIDRLGVRVNDESVAEARRSFKISGCVAFPELIDNSLAASLSRMLLDSDFVPGTYTKGDKIFGSEVRLHRSHPVVHALSLLVNHPEVYRQIERITGCQPIGCFEGRVGRMGSSGEHFLNWHTDAVEDRLLGLTVNLSLTEIEGGVFCIRRKVTPDDVTQVPCALPGSAHLFSIDPAFEHCVSQVSGTAARTVFVGWFRPGPRSLRLTPIR